MKKKKFTKIRENITEIEYQKLLIYLNGKEDLATNTKNNLRRTFILLYFRYYVALAQEKISKFY